MEMSKKTGNATEKKWPIINMINVDMSGRLILQLQATNIWEICAFAGF